MKSKVLHTVWCNIPGEAAGEIWNWSLLGLKGLKIDEKLILIIPQYWHKRKIYWATYYGHLMFESVVDKATHRPVVFHLPMPCHCNHCTSQTESSRCCRFQWCSDRFPFHQLHCWDKNTDAEVLSPTDVSDEPFGCTAPEIETHSDWMKYQVTIS